MIKNSSKTTKRNEINHIQLEGRALIDRWTKHEEQGDTFYFTPDQLLPGMTDNWRKRGTGQLASDGTFEFVAQPKLRSQAVLIKKLPHGRLSETHDGFIQLTLKIPIDEPVDKVAVIAEEAATAAIALRIYQQNL